MIFGYARVSTLEQNLDRQTDALKVSGAEKIFKEKITGTKEDRPQLNKMIEQLRSGDIIVIESLSRLGRSTRNLISLMEKLNGMGVNVISLKESINTTTPTGKLIFTMFSAFAQFERDIIVERTKEGLESARARGRVGGRKEKLDQRAKETVFDLYKAKKMSVGDICKMFGISKPTLYRIIEGLNNKEIKE